MRTREAHRGFKKALESCIPGEVMKYSKVLYKRGFRAYVIASLEEELMLPRKRVEAWMTFNNSGRAAA